MTDADDYVDPDRAAWEQLMWLKFEQGQDVEAELAAFTDRRHEEGERVRERRAALGEPEPEPVWQPVGVVTEPPSAESRAAKRAVTPVVTVDTLTGRITGGRLDHNRPPGALPFYDY